MSKIEQIPDWGVIALCRYEKERTHAQTSILRALLPAAIGTGSALPSTD
jgi:hypothetical protein